MDKVIGFFLILVLVSALLGVGVSLGSGAERKAALDAGVAYWKIDATTGVREFVYGTK